MDIAVCNFSVVLPLLAKVPSQIEGRAYGVLGVLGIAARKSKNSNDSLPIRGLQVSAPFQETIGRVVNKFSHGTGKSGRSGIVISEFIFISHITSHDAHFVRFRLSIERNCSLPDTAKFFAREAVAEKSTR